MSVESPAMFACGACGKQFKWKPAIAGKAAKCACGNRVEVPSTEPGRPAPEDQEENLFDGIDFSGAVAAPAPAYAPAPSRPAPKPSRATPPAKGGKPAAKGGTPAAGPAKVTDPRFHRRANVGPTREEIEASRNVGFWGLPKERPVPLIMIGLSAMAFFGACAAHPTSSGGYLVIMTIYSLICVVALTAAAFVTAAIAGLSFGIMGIAIIRFAAISYACLAVNELFLLARFEYMGYINPIATYAIFTFGMMGFFGLEYAETRLVAFVATILKFALALGVIVAVAAMAPSAALDDDDDEGFDDDDTPAMVSKQGKSTTPATQPAGKADDDEEK